MVKIILVFCLVSIIVYAMITGVQRMGWLSRWKLTKRLGLSLLCCILTVSILTTIVYIF